MTIEERVAVLEATEDVKRLFSRYTWALDHGDVEGIVRCFTDDGVFEFGGAKWAGVEAVRHYFTEDRKLHTSMLHYPVNVVVDVQMPGGDASRPEVAEARCTLWDLFNRERDSGREGACLAGYYHLSAHHDGENWRIAHLKVTTKWLVPVQEWRLMDDFHADPELRS